MLRFWQVSPDGHVDGMLPGAPAARSKRIALGDAIRAVDGTRIDGRLRNTEGVHHLTQLIIGDDLPGSMVDLELLRRADGTPFHVKLERMPTSDIREHRKHLFEILCKMKSLAKGPVSHPQPSARPSPVSRSTNSSPSRVSAASPRLSEEPASANTNTTPRPCTPPPLDEDSANQWAVSNPTAENGVLPAVAPESDAASKNASIQLLDEALMLWGQMVEEEDTRAEQLLECRNELDNLENIFQNVKQLPNVRDAERYSTEEAAEVNEVVDDEADLKLCLEQQQRELGDLALSLRGRFRFDMVGLIL
jgi:hypothetical protein